MIELVVFESHLHKISLDDFEAPDARTSNRLPPSAYFNGPKRWKSQVDKHGRDTLHCHEEESC